MRLAGMGLIGAAALSGVLSGPAKAQELSEKSVFSIMEYAWALTPEQFSTQSGKTIIVDKSKKAEVIVPLETAREVIKVGRLSAHAQVCNLQDEQTLNHRSLMRREEDKKKWTDQQMLYINQLHLSTIMLLTGKIKVVEKDGDKEVQVDETKAPAQTCSDEQKTKVKELIMAYVETGPKVSLPPPAATAAVPAPISPATPAVPAAAKPAAPAAAAAAPAPDTKAANKQ